MSNILILLTFFLVSCSKPADVDPQVNSQAPTQKTTPKKQELLDQEVVKLQPTTEYYAQIGAFKDKNNALKIREEIKVLGANVVLRKKTIKKQQLILVEIGPFPSPDLARDYTSKARERIVDIPPRIYINKYLND